MATDAKTALRGRPRLALIGCGAVVENYYMPALEDMGWVPAMFIDRDMVRAEKLARPLGSQVGSDFVQAMDEFDAAVVAVPNSFHASIAIQLLKEGKHVLVEKPMATNAADCVRMIREAEGAGAALAVGLRRRFLPGLQWVKALLDSGVLGPVESFQFREGEVFDWPLASDGLWRKDSAGGGVLFDTGAHTLDLLTWWLGEATIVSYVDDSYGGVEADCLIEIELGSGGTGSVELSRTRNLGNTAMLECLNGTIEVSLWEDTVRAAPPEILETEFGGTAAHGFHTGSIADNFRAQLTDWTESIDTGTAPRATGEEGAKSVALIESCYSKREVWDLPWVEPAHASGPVSGGPGQ